MISILLCKESIIFEAIKSILAANCKGNNLSKMENTDLIKNLNKIIEVNFDSHNLYRTGSSNIINENYKYLLKNYSQRRYYYLKEIREIIKEYNGEVEKVGSLTGLLRRGWTDIKAALADDDIKAVINECIRVDKHAIKVYNEVFDEYIHSDIKQILRDQKNGIRETIDRLNQLKEEGIIKKKE